MKEPGKFIEAIMVDARFEHGPHHGQVRSVMLGTMSLQLEYAGAVHVYDCKRHVDRDGRLVGLVFRHVGRS